MIHGATILQLDPTRHMWSQSNGAYLRQSCAKLMHQAQIEEGLGIAKLGGRLVQLSSSGPAPIDSPPIPVAVTQLQQRIHIPLSMQHPSL